MKLLDSVCEASPTLIWSTKFSLGQLASRLSSHPNRSRRSCFLGRHSKCVKDYSHTAHLRFSSSAGSTTPLPGAVICVESYNRTLCLFIVCRIRTVHQDFSSTFVRHFCWRVPRHKESGVSGRRFCGGSTLCKHSFGSGDVPTLDQFSYCRKSMCIFSYSLRVVNRKSRDSSHTENFMTFRSSFYSVG